MDIKNKSLQEAPLGKKSCYVNEYTPSLLFPVPRKIKRDEIGLTEKLPFVGFDIWTAFELSWLNPKGKPVVAVGEFRVPCESPNIVESKSFKLYLNSFNGSRFESFAQVTERMERDLSKCVGANVVVRVMRLDEVESKITRLEGTCLDDLDLECTEYQPNPGYLARTDESVEEILNTNLLKSNCLVTGQPDWGSLLIKYRGQKIDHSGLLKYVVSLRDHNEFHEQCVERIFSDILRLCKPEQLTVLARYTRRGGLDINPFRTSVPAELMGVENIRLVRQ